MLQIIIEQTNSLWTIIMLQLRTFEEYYLIFLRICYLMLLNSKQSVAVIFCQFS